MSNIWQLIMGRVRAVIGMSKVRQALLSLTIIYAVICGSAFLYVTHSNSVERGRQQRQGQVLELKLCTTLNKLASLTPPPGNPKTNPSRAYLQEQHDVLSQLGRDVGCR